MIFFLKENKFDLILQFTNYASFNKSVKYQMIFQIAFRKKTVCIYQKTYDVPRSMLIVVADTKR